ncbi:ATP-binding protein [Limnohabitans sp. 2KL-3]|uniref:AAA family ATPase n=1 Tax=Limnohabitans sp. 2KL-3 TaxID=1100700 RepID=UPI000B2E19C5|nr:ATP-binding protein [Limnohabitans sp. 2KL-3]
MSFEDVNDVVSMKESFLDMDPAVDDLQQDLETHPRRDRKTKNAQTPVYLVVSEEVSEDALAELAEADMRYARWLRVVMLRLMIKTPALGRLKGRVGYNLNQVCAFLGFENFEKYAENRNLAEIRHDLSIILSGWEAEVGQGCHFPRALQNNLKALAHIINLNPMEAEILGLGVLIHAESILESCSELLGAELTGYNIERILGPLLAQKSESVSKCLQRQEKLASSGLLSIDISGRYGLRQLVDLLTSTFASRMLAPQDDIRKIVESFVLPVAPSSLTVQDYDHIQTNLEICKSLLTHCVDQNVSGINVLIYGKPGTGKTEFARLLASELDLSLMEISPHNLAGAPVVPIRRVRNYRIAQEFFKHNPSAILFDECEEILNHVSGNDRGDHEATIPRKSWINKILETNDVPTIWIANSIERFDEAYLRRFSFCFEMPIPSQFQREKLLAKAVDGVVSAQAQVGIARHKDVTPAMLIQTAKVVKAIASQRPESERDALAIHLTNNRLKAQSKGKIISRSDLGIAGGGFKPEWVNSDVDLQALSESIVQSRAGRLCLYGPPGTGKTAFGKWLAQELDVPHMVLKASEILSPYLGETEQKMARAFEAADQQKAVLQFDEVDSFLQDRQKASKQWEVTQVNEMLTQMENFQGVFIASTNLFQNLDEASLRRFDMAIKFDFLKADAAQSMFIKTCNILGVSNQEQILLAEAANMTQLTPGDFEQLIRRSRLLRFGNSAQILQQLKSAVALKKSTATRPIGFLKAA